jgi:eukaryotic-like serine/threonine-protein kinase
MEVLGERAAHLLSPRLPRITLPSRGPVSLSPGQTFARYIIERELGHGGMGRVFLATDSVLKRKVALKVLLPERMAGEGPARFEREASMGAMVTHPNIVAVYDYGMAEGRSFIAMEYVEGETLSTYIGDTTVPLGKRLMWVLDTAQALVEAHDHGLVHRDIKPSNLMVTRGGMVKVLDFGLAKRPLTSDPGAFRTLEGLVLGTPRYMAPEQIVGLNVSPRTDQYSLGVVAYELLTGQHPNGANGRVDPPKLLTEIDRTLPFRLAVLVARMLAKRPEDRFPSMHEVNAEIERIVADVAPESLARDTVPHADANLGMADRTTDPGAARRMVTLPLAAPEAPPTVSRAGRTAFLGSPTPALKPNDMNVPPGVPPPRIPPGKTLPSPGSDPPPQHDGFRQQLGDGTLRSADEPNRKPLGHAVDEAARQALAAQSARRAGLSPPPPSQAVVLMPSSTGGTATWSKSMWLTVIAVGIVGVLAGALLAGWAMTSSAPTPPAPKALPPG